MDRSRARLRRLVAQLHGPGTGGRTLAHVAGAEDPPRVEESAAPVLTQAQRLQIEVDGFIVVPNVLSAEETSTLREAMYEMERCWRQTGELPPARDPNHHSWLTSNTPDFWRVDNVPHLGQCFLDYVAHPRLTAIVQEMIGVSIRLEQSDAHIRRQPTQLQGRPGFHAGPHTSGVGPYGRHSASDWYRFAYVKTLTNLTDLAGPEDGGTLVIRGSHKLGPEVPIPEVIDGALSDPALGLVSQVVNVPAGSTLIFFESLLHAGGTITSGRDRLLIIAGYTPSMMQAHMGYDPDPELLATLPQEQRALLSGSDKYHWGGKHQAGPDANHGPRHAVLSGALEAREASERGDAWQRLRNNLGAP